MEAGSRNPLISSTDTFAVVDSDGIQWSPDGRWIALSASRDGSQSILLVDVASGDARRLDIDDPQREVYWRPPDGRQLLFLGPGQNGVDLFLLSVESGDIQQLGAGGDAAGLRALGWTPDGDRFLYHREGGTSPTTTILDLATRTESVLDVAYGQLSNDGTRVFGMDGVRVCVIAIDGGPCRGFGDGALVYDGGWHEGVFWSPDDQWIVVHRSGLEGQRPPVLVDPDAGRVDPAPWIQAGAESWQRLAP